MKILLNVVYSSTLEKWQYNKKRRQKKQGDKFRTERIKRKKKTRKNKRVNSFMYWGECSVLK